MLALVLSGCIGAPSDVGEARAPLSRGWGPVVSFTFDDGYASDLPAFVTLHSHGIMGASYVVTDWVGRPGRLDWDLLHAMEQYGWEVGSHTVSHPFLASTAGGTQDCVPPYSQVDEIECSRLALVEHGLHPYGIAFPHGDFDATSMRLAAGRYHYARGFHDGGPESPWVNVFPHSRHEIETIDVTWCDTAETIERRLCQALYDEDEICGADRPRHDRWAVVVLHEIFEDEHANPDCPPPSESGCGCGAATDGYWGWSMPRLEALASWAEATLGPHVSFARPADVLGSIDPRTGAITPHGTELHAHAQLDLTTTGISPFVAGAGTVAFRSYGYGIAPTPGTSLGIVGAIGGTRYVRSAPIAVSAATHYIVEVAIGLAAMRSGVIGLYVDEYNASGTWISGQNIGWICQGGSGCLEPPMGIAQSVRSVADVYRPSSSAVRRVRLQVYLNGVDGLVYVDGLSLRAL